MKKNNLRPFVLFVAEVIYIKISEIKKNNKNLSNKEAIEKFIDSKNFDEISSGKFHDTWFNDLKKNNFYDQNSGMKINRETFALLQIQKDTMIKQLIKIPNLYNVEDNNLLEISTRAYKLIFRMCESYELWCKETKQPDLIILKIVD